MRSLPAVITVAAVIALGLSGCVPQGSPEPTETTDWTATQQPTTTPTDTPEPAVTDEPAGGFDSVPVSIDCNKLVSPQVVYDYNPNYGHQPDFTPAPGTDVATIEANQGAVCNWVNQSSGVTFEVAVAQLAADDLATVREGLPSNTAVSGIGDAAYFAASGGVGVAQVFSGPYWIVATSPAFYEIVEPRPLLQGALTALGQ
ncbi:MAG: arginyl-tRNA synthetase [Homoserinimonas sp.]